VVLCKDATIPIGANSEAYYSGVYLEQLPTFKVRVFHQKFCQIVAGFIDAKKLFILCTKSGIYESSFFKPFETFKIFDGDADSTFLAAIKL